MTVSVMLSRRELENTRVDLRRWSEQLLEISAELSTLVHDLDRRQDNGGNGGAEDAEGEPGREGR